MGLSLDDFCRLTYEEFNQAYKAYATQRECDYKDAWSRMRLLACITIQPHLGKGRKMTPEKLIEFPWEKAEKAERRRNAPKVSKEEQLARMKIMAEKYAKNNGRKDS